MPLTDNQKRTKAETILREQQLREDLANINMVLDSLLARPQIQNAETIDAQELKDLVSAIQAGAASNIKVSRFLELINENT